MLNPANEQFMDSDMRRFWRGLGPLPGDLRLYGGTALALYRNHRASTDFDFATPQAVIDQDFVRGIPFFEAATLRGGPGMVDAAIKGPGRELLVTFMECGRVIPEPVQAPLKASNGVLVAHPVDLAAAKLTACMGRGAKRDYEDVAEMIGAWPAHVRSASRIVAERQGEHGALARALASPPPEVAGELDEGARTRLRRFAREQAGRDYGIDR